MPADEFDKWFLYFNWKHEQEKKAQRKQNAKGGANKTVTKY